MKQDNAATPPITLVFDLDGTLVDTSPDLIDVLNETLAGLALPPITEAEGRRFIGAGIRPLIERALAAEGRRLPDETLDRLFEAYIASYASRIARLSRPFPGLVSALDTLAAQGMAFAVCTNKLESLSRRLLGELGLGDRFRAISGGDTFSFRKPDRRHLLQTIANAGGAAERAVMIGDSETDVATARNAGIPVITVSFGYTELPPDQLGGDKLINHFEELPRAVQDVIESNRMV